MVNFLRSRRNTWLKRSVPAAVLLAGVGGLAFTAVDAQAQLQPAEPDPLLPCASTWDQSGDGNWHLIEKCCPVGQRPFWNNPDGAGGQIGWYTCVPA